MGQWQLKWTGAPELERSLRDLPSALTRAVLMDALIAGAEPMARRMGELAPRGPFAPHLGESILIVPGKSDDEHSASVRIGPAQDFFYGWFWEFGWKDRAGKAHSARPFMRPGYDEQVDRALMMIGNRLWLAIARHAQAHLPQGGGA